MMNRDQAIDGLKQKLDQWNADLDRLENRAGSYSDERRKELEDAIDQLKDKREEAVEAFQQLGSASDDAFDDLSQGALQAWARMSESLEKAKERFN
jgi:uncharacterized coiled-coil DUF342 family protein